MAAKLTTLIVDSELSVRFLVSQALQTAGYKVITATDMDEARQKLATCAIDIVISNLYDGHSHLVGLQILKDARRIHPHCEVILITGTPDLNTAIEALREGACDYLATPVKEATILESVTRAQNRLLQQIQNEDALMTIELNIRKILGRPSRENDAKPTVPPESGERYQIGPVILDTGRHMIEVNGQAINATSSEVQILEHLCHNSRRVIAPQELIRSIRGYSVEPGEAQATIRTHISNLRRKLSMAAPDADIITTVRSLGYSLKTPPQSLT